MSAVAYDDAIELSRSILRQCKKEERLTNLSGFHAVSDQIKTTLECLLHLNPEVSSSESLIQNADRLVIATLDNLRANIESTLKKLLSILMTWERTPTVSRQASSFATQQRLLVLKDTLSANTQDILSYFNRLRAKKGVKHVPRRPLAETNVHNLPSEHQPYPISQSTLNKNLYHRRQRSSPEQRGRSYSRADSLHNGSVVHPPASFSRGEPQDPAANGRKQGRDPRIPPIPSPRRDNDRRRPRSMPATPSRRIHSDLSGASSPQAICPVSILFVDSFNGTRSLLGQSYAEIVRLWTLNNGGSSPFSSISSAGSRIVSTLVNAKSTQDRTLYEPGIGIINQNALRMLFAHSVTTEENNVASRMLNHVPRGLTVTDLMDFDFILTLDSTNLSRLLNIKRKISPQSRTKVILLDRIYPPKSASSLPHRPGHPQPRPLKEEPDYAPLIQSTKIAFLDFLTKHTNWTPPRKSPFSYRTLLRSRQFIVPVGIREPTAKRINDLRLRTGCAIAMDKTGVRGEGGGGFAVATVTGREEGIGWAAEEIRKELGGWYG
ncbi:MAG: hypothetical protein M1820_009359 [Bogoriella megaspora]|nr:MAG: hypothetical protein M1820_009359 [Bogoriella megaspora]